MMLPQVQLPLADDYLDTVCSMPGLRAVFSAVEGVRCVSLSGERRVFGYGDGEYGWLG